MLITIWSVSIKGSLSYQCLRTFVLFGEGSALYIALGLTQRQNPDSNSLPPDQEAKTCATDRVDEHVLY